MLRDDPVTMKCRASGSGVTYTWYKNGSILTNDKNSLVLKDGSLFLIHAAGGKLFHFLSIIDGHQLHLMT